MAETENDFVAADRAWWRRHFPETPDMGRLIRHAERYGSDGVYETAESYAYPLPQLLQLDAELTRIDTERKQRFKDVPKRKRPTAEDKVQAILFLHAEGIPTVRIAKTLGLSPGHVATVRAKALAA